MRTMNETLSPVATHPIATTRSRLCHSFHGHSPENKLYLRADCFGLGSFISAYDLQPEIGDLVQIDRVLYSDWALYVGDGSVVHVSAGLDVSADGNSNEIPSDEAVVRLSSLVDVAGGNGVRVNNKSVGAKERGLEPRPIDDVLESCYSCLEKEVDFNMLTRNSEHYVTEWKYGQGWSDQAAVTMSVMKNLTEDCTFGHNVLVSSLNAVLNSPGSPLGRLTPNFSSSPVNGEKH